MRSRFAVTIPSLWPSSQRTLEELQHAGERLEVGVERLVVRAVGLHELVDPVGVEVAHLRDQPGPADRRANELLVRLAPEHGERTHASSRRG